MWSVEMTIAFEYIRKLMGWCPNTGIFEGRQYAHLEKIELDILDGARGGNEDFKSELNKTSNFITNVLKLASGSIIAQILSMLSVILILRFYTPEDFGTSQLILSLSNILIIFSTFSYQYAILLPKKKEDSANLVCLCAILITLTSLLTATIVLLFPNYIDKLSNAPGISKYFIYIPAITFFNGIFLTQNYWLLRKTNFGVIAESKVINSISTGALQLAIPIWNASPVGLIAGYVSGYGCTDLFMLKRLREDIKVFRQVSLKRIKEMAIQYKNFPLFNSSSTLANTISLQSLTIILLEHFYGANVVGCFVLASQIVNVPLGLIGVAIEQVFFQKISAVKYGNEPGDVKAIVREVYQKLTLIGIFPMILLLILGEEISKLVFEENWYLSCTYVKILAPWMFLVFLSLPISALYMVFEKQGVWFAFSITLLISRVMALVIGGTYGSPEFALGLFSFTGIMFCLWNNAYLLNLAGINKLESIEVLIKYTTIGIVISVPLILLKMVSVNYYIIILAVCIITPIYYVVTLHNDKKFKSLFSAFLVNAKNKI
jgi:lipopolysaccharide exporter